MRILGLDPGLEHTGYGVIEVRGNAYTFIAAGRITTKTTMPIPQRLAVLAAGLEAVLAEYKPEAAAVEEVYVNKNMQSSLKLAQARAVALLVPTQKGVPVHEYAARLVKQSLVGKGNAEKPQVAHMVGVLLPASRTQKLAADASDALAVALTHAHHAHRFGIK
jgi:crossover junction endodeoxyribonuclease RuvC